MPQIRWLLVAWVCFAASAVRADADTAVSPRARAPCGLARSSDGNGVLPLLAHADFRAYQRLLRSQIASVDRAQKCLAAAGRPEHYRRRRIGGFVGIGVGGVAVATTLALVVAVLGPPLPHSGPSGEFSAPQRVLLPLSFALGSAVMAAGLWALGSANDGHHYREPMEALTRERHRLVETLADARRTR
jgi:hypothetical protein